MPYSEIKYSGNGTLLCLHDKALYWAVPVSSKIFYIQRYILSRKWIALGCFLFSVHGIYSVYKVALFKSLWHVAVLQERCYHWLNMVHNCNIVIRKRKDFKKNNFWKTAKETNASRCHNSPSGCERLDQLLHIHNTYSTQIHLNLCNTMT